MKFEIGDRVVFGRMLGYVADVFPSSQELFVQFDKVESVYTFTSFGDLINTPWRRVSEHTNRKLEHAPETAKTNGVIFT